MKSTLRSYVPVWAGVVLFLFFWLQPGPVGAGVCSEGTGIPPFLSAGVDPNLLLVLDNSGSMLDMAYVDNDTECFDDGYDPTDTYAGYFESDSWYVWQGGAGFWKNDGSKVMVTDPWVAPWQHGVTYSQGDIVYANGGLYRSVTSGTAVSNDTDPRDGYNITDDEGVEWEPVSQAETVTDLPASCTDNMLVTYENAVFICRGGDWLRLEGGQFLEQEETVALAACSTAGGVQFNYTDEVCITVENVTIAAAPPLPEATVQKEMNAFAARGNFLNWALSSKFDIEKKILTGGKYIDFDETDSEPGQLIEESRGCAGYGFVKQVPMRAADGSTDYLVMRVRGANTDDRVGHLPKEENSDDTTRLEIIGINSAGFNQGACQIVIDKLMTNPNTLSQNQIDACLSGTNEVGISQAALSTSVNVCRSLNDIANPVDTDVPNLVTTVAAKCESLFTNYGYSPTTMSPEDGGYVCYGIYDNDEFPFYGVTDADGYRDHRDRVGYLGRCWNSPGTAADCKPKAEVSSAEHGCDRTDVRCTYCDDGSSPKCSNQNIYKNESGYNYKCTDVKGNASRGYYCAKDDDPSDWQLLYAVEGTATECTPGDAAAGGWDPSWLPSSSPGDVVLQCITQAMIDFCGDLKVPEVIDPSDEATTTTDYWNIPAMLIDGGVLGQMGVAKPLAVMKGLIKYDLSTEQLAEQTEVPERPDGPRGVFYEVASDLRLGVMAFADNGSKAECDLLIEKCKDEMESDGTSGSNDIPDVCDIAPDSTDCEYCNDRKSIIKFCPDSNGDGAEVLQPVSLGKKVVKVDATTTVEDWDHYNNLVASVNDTRATSWTPLGEAMYNAIGYFTQNDDFCLADDTSGDCVSFPIDSSDDPVQYWCQDNHVLVITEGASTADINTDLAGFVSAPSSYFVSQESSDDVSGDNDNRSDSFCADGLDGSTYFDDMTWWGRHVQPLYSQRSITNSDGVAHDKQNITTHVVTTGSLRTEGTGECSPAAIMLNAADNGGTTLYSGENPDQLESNLLAVFSDILGRASAGSAASVISSSRSGSGAVYQAIFWPELIDAGGSTVNWVGDVHALFMSSGGLMYEDTNLDGKLEPSGDLNNNGMIDNDEAAGGADRRVIFYYSDGARKTRGCYNITDFMAGGFICPDDPADGLCQSTDDCVEIQNINYLWSASNKLREMAPSARKIFTWNDANNNGMVDSYGTDDDEWFSLDNDVAWATLNTTAAAAGSARGSVTQDFLTAADWLSFVDNDGYSDAELESDALAALVDWIRGTDPLNGATDLLANETAATGDSNTNGRLDKVLRSRQFTLNGITKEWRLGDIIHSTPIVVARPAEAYHYIYRDPSYAAFYRKWVKRRNMVYFGANDGMLHAVNGGFYFEHLNQFCCTDELDSDNNCVVPVTNGTCSTGPDLGEELWAYIPYNLQPHLKCLANPEYDHKYYVDQKPRIFDVQIFEEELACQSAGGFSDPDCIHPGGWGTILVGSMRFGGSPVLASDLNGDADDKRELSSSFFILDITSPEKEPILLGEMTRTVEDNDEKYVDLNYTTSSPSMVVMRDNDTTTDWYLVMGSGPTDIDGSNLDNDQGKLAVMPLDWLTGTDNGKRAFRILNKRPDGASRSDLTNSEESGVFNVPASLNGERASYISDIITVDFDVENPAEGSAGAFYRSDAVYFGTTDKTDFANYPSPDCDQTYWNGGGRLFRLVTKVLDGSDKEEQSSPSDWAGEWSSVDNDPVRLLVDTRSPITAAPSVGFDGENFWVYAGTGRFYDKNDKTDNGLYGSYFSASERSPSTSNERGKTSYFGIREPVDTNGNCKDRILTWDSIYWNVNEYDNSMLSRNSTPGSRGLMQVDNILVAEQVNSMFTNASYLKCSHCVDNDENRYDPSCSASSYDCFPSDMHKSTVYYRDNDDSTQVVTFPDLQEYIAGTGCSDDNTSTGIDGWYRDFHEPRERNLGQAALLGGLLVFTGYQPYADLCQAEGESFLYGVHFQTGTAWTESIFGTFFEGGESFVMDKLSLGRGLATTPSMQVGTGDQAASAFIQTSTGEIIEVKIENLPLGNAKSGRSSWSDRCGP